MSNGVMQYVKSKAKIEKKTASVSDMQLMNSKLTVDFKFYFYRYNNFQNAFHCQILHTIRSINLFWIWCTYIHIDILRCPISTYVLFKMINCLLIVFSGHHRLRQMLVRQTPIPHHFRQKPRFGRETGHGWPSRKGQCRPSTHLSCSKCIKSCNNWMSCNKCISRAESAYVVQ